MPAEEGFIISGFPRSLSQVFLLDRSSLKYDQLILLTQPEDLLYEKSKLRLFCEKCAQSFCNSSLDHEDYHLPSMSQVDSFCPFCRSALTRRKDDEQRSFKRRFFQFKVFSEDLLKLYSSKNFFLEFKLLRGVDDLGRLIRQIEDLNEKLKPATNN